MTTTDTSAAGTDCPRAGRLFRGCHFEARYDEPTLAGFFGAGWHSAELKINGEMASINDAAPLKKYVRDVCIRCGRAVERKPEPTS